MKMKVGGNEKDGTRYWVNFINTPLYDAEGNLRGYARIARDTTEKRIAEETLRQKIVMEQKMVLVDVLQSVTIAINLAPTVEDAVATLLKEVCTTQSGLWVAATLWIRNQKANARFRRFGISRKVQKYAPMTRSCARGF